jgi:hypothetical protein
VERQNLFHSLHWHNAFRRVPQAPAGHNATHAHNAAPRARRRWVIDRKVNAEVPPKAEYSVSEAGKSIKPIIESTWHWGNEFLSRLPENKVNQPENRISVKLL